MTDKKTRGNTSNLTPGNPGNSGGKKGRSGRKPGWWKEWCGKTLHDPKVKAAIKRKAADGDLNAVKLLAHYSEGVPVKTVKLEGGDGPLAFTFKFHQATDGDDSTGD